MIHVAMDKLDSADHRATMEIPPDADGKTMRLMCLIWGVYCGPLSVVAAFRTHHYPGPQRSHK